MSFRFTKEWETKKELADLQFGFNLSHPNTKKIESLEDKILKLKHKRIEDWEIYLSKLN